jgi:endonuclease YncB( thermonuclease family)
MAWLRRTALAVLALLPLIAHAKPHDTAVAALPEVAAGTVQSIEDGATLTLADGKILRLAGLIAPVAPLSMSKDAPWPAAEAARQALADLALGQTITLRAAQDKPDRHGRLVGQAMLGEGTWLQRDLLRQGRDRLELTRDLAPVAPMLLKAEADARRHHRGLWRLPIYAVRAPDHLTARDTGGFVLVEGRVLSVAPTHESTFLDFAEDWHHGFTVRIPHAVLQRADGFDPAALEGQRVRVRGWLAYEGRPILDLEDIAALELLPNARKATKRP